MAVRALDYLVVIISSEGQRGVEPMSADRYSGSMDLALFRMVRYINLIK